MFLFCNYHCDLSVTETRLLAQICQKFGSIGTESGNSVYDKMIHSTNVVYKKPGHQLTCHRHVQSYL